ncbi:isopentenyl-diphosphate delta-isomerase [Gracilibacillus halotolerans]|uniref:Isopentenyl-diphosphate delta-isomerase n=1 Tax=Gracilibacillus halotolerans TaxID=74386 RepID=A0A841RMQ1_9BACI|nr:type 2 isopentenyl-diphosphate Delta-isomerase [Gracilibacillus halotolerans]MBB6513172.1 isopentenyl-diphosphate delta-isomerase [Gracilibacillus halotolerans]
MTNIHQRKSEHIQHSLSDASLSKKMTGFDRYQFRHCALPELDFSEIDMRTDFFQRPVNTPFLVSSMTGGVELASKINRNLAQAAESRGWILALGSTRIMLESEQHRESFQVRSFAPTIPIIANIGAVQLNYGVTSADILKIIEWTDADALVFHLNSIQEIIQTNGDTNFSNLLRKMENIIKDLHVPVGVKEVGFGIDGEVAQKLMDIGISYIDVAGAGGTSWSQVEKLRSTDEVKKEAAEAFADWGISTSDCLELIKEKSIKSKLMASGGIKNGHDSAKAIALGAHHVGFARELLKPAMESEEAVMTWMEKRELELRMVMFGIGAGNLQELIDTSRLVKQKG